MNVFSNLRNFSKAHREAIKQSRETFVTVKRNKHIYHVDPEMAFHCQLCHNAYLNYYVSDKLWAKLPTKVQKYAICHTCFEAILTLQKTHTITEN